MNEEKRINITLKTLIIIIAIIIILLLIVLFAYIYITESTNGLLGEISTIDIAIISHEGTFYAKGVVVRPEKDTLTIMPIIANEEYINREEFYYENNNQLNLKQGQEVIVTFHYRESSKEDYTNEAVIENIEIVKEKSEVEIPNDILVKAYSSKDNISISLDNEISSNKRINFIITDNNEFKYDYSTMKYDLRKHNTAPTSTEIVYSENGSASILPYDPWPELPKINDSSNEESFALDENGQLSVDIDWTEVYGEIGEGEYTFKISTVSTPRQSILNPYIIDYPYDGVIIEINFVIDTNNKIEYGEIKVH